MNILVTGANGQLGNELQLAAKGSKDHYIFTDVCDNYQKLDITSLEAVRKMVGDNDVKCIINCAAWTNVDAAETAGEIVETLNATAPEHLAVAMKEVGGLLIHVSTDYVFGGDPYKHRNNSSIDYGHYTRTTPRARKIRRERLPASTD